MKQRTIPQTISTSYGDDEQTVPQDYAKSVCDLFAQLGAMGVTLLFSSGDDGVGGGSCRSNDSTGRVKFIPNFPASCGFYILSMTNSCDLLDGGYKVPSSRPLVARFK
jgi:tripeptidyl-peptidase-1